MVDIYEAKLGGEKWHIKEKEVIKQGNMVIKGQSKLRLSGESSAINRNREKGSSKYA